MIQNILYKTTWLCGEIWFLCQWEWWTTKTRRIYTEIQRQDVTVHHDRPVGLARNPARSSAMGEASDQGMESCDEHSKQCAEDGTAVGEAVNPLLPEHLSLCLSPEPAPAAAQLPLPKDARHSSWRPRGGCEGEDRNESCDLAWDSVGLAPPQADVFGHCSRLSWETAPSFSSASLSKLCLCLWPSALEVDSQSWIFAAAFIWDNCS